MPATRLLIAFIAVLGAVVALAAVVPGDAFGWRALWIAAATTAVTLGIAGTLHAIALPQLDRTRVVDRLIAACGVATLSGVVALAAIGTWAPGLARTLLVLGAPLWLLGCAFAAYVLAAAWTAVRRAPRATPRTIVVLGAGLRGRVPGTLLRRRVELGAARWRAAGGVPARIVVCGGQGPDEIVTEARAMADWLIEHEGVPAGSIALEDASTSTEENLVFALRDHVRAADRPILVVTSDYHVLRTELLLQRVRLDARVVGSWSRPGYRPGALVRELLALLAMFMRRPRHPR